MTGKVTRASVEEFVRDRPYMPIQVDGIPEGFSFEREKIIIGGTEYPGSLIAFVPFSNWDSDEMVYGKTKEELLENYKIKSIKYGKRN